MADTNNNKVMAVLCYFWILWLVPMFTDSKDDPFVKFHINQGILLTITWIVVGLAGLIIGLIPVIGPIINWLARVALFVLMVIGILNSINMEEKPLPIIGTLYTVYK